MTRTSLFLVHRLPYPPNKGDKVRSFALLRHLAARGPVRVGCFIDEAGDLAHRQAVRDIAGGDCHFETLGPWRRRGRGIAALLNGVSITQASFHSDAMQDWVSQAVGAVDDIVVFSSAMAPYVQKSHRGSETALLDLVDVDSDKWAQYATRAVWPMKQVYAREARKLRQLEIGAAQSFGATFLCSPFEAKTLAGMMPQGASRVGFFNNGVDQEVFKTYDAPNPFAAGIVPIVMTGRMDYWPNSQGALWFADKVMPHLLKAVPAAHVYFVGAHPPKALHAIAGSHITVTGAVPDVRPYILHARAVIAPLLMARGVQNKVLEAMAMEKPVVTTWEATRALAAEPGVHLWVENDPVRFAAAVADAATGPHRLAVAHNALQFVRAHHNWKSTLAPVDRALEELHGNARRNFAAAGAAAPHLAARAMSSPGGML